MSGDHSALIAPLGAAGRADEIVIRISEAIQLGLLTHGERLPPELEFSQQFGVSPVTLREAIATLRERGLIETRRGRTGGSFVRRTPEPDEAPDLARLKALPATALRDLSDDHVATAAFAARLAAERASPSDLRRIRRLAEQLASSRTRGERMKADSRFHIEVAIATKSERLTRREVALQGESVGLLWTAYLPETEAEVVAAEHDAIVEAIACEDGPGAAEKASQHVRNNLRRLIAAHMRLNAQSRRIP